MNITLKDEDIRAMPKELRVKFLQYILENIDTNTGEKVQDIPSDDSEIEERLNIVYPSVIPIEGAAAIISGLNQNSVNVLKTILNSSQNEDQKTNGLTRSEISEITGVKVGSINGTIGSINRRALYRFNRQVYDFEADHIGTRLIHFSEESGKYKFSKARKSRLNFLIAIKICESGFFFENNGIELIFPNKKGIPNTKPEFGQKEKIQTDQPRLKLSSEAFENFNYGQALVDFYQEHDDLKYSDEAELLFTPIRKKWMALRNSDIEIHACCLCDCHSVQFTENGFSIDIIRPAEFLGPTKKVATSVSKKEFLSDNFSAEKIRVRSLY